jgi:hypothetical protein
MCSAVLQGERLALPTLIEQGLQHVFEQVVQSLAAKVEAAYSTRQ